MLELDYLETGTFQNQVSNVIMIDQSIASRKLWHFIKK